MARRKKKQPDAATAVLIILGGLGVFLLLKTLVENNAIPFLLVAAVCLGVLIIVVQTSRRNKVLETIDAITNRHIAELVRQRTILIRNDPYGRPMLDKWYSHVDYFITHHVRLALSPSQQTIVDKRRAIISQRILQRVEEAITQSPALLTMPENITPAGFEAYCAETLRKCGWQVSLTPLCRDQGVDVIAEKNGVRVALQCKLYSKPVPNKAVQEISAGRIHQQAQYGAVVTNSTYTTSAQELAATNRIKLLHHTDLLRLENIFGEQSA
jgi:Restriction endonuclease